MATTRARSGMTISARVDLSPGVSAFLFEQAQALGITPEKAVTWAVGFLGTLAQAKREGKRLALTDDEFNVEREIIGF